MKNNNLGVNTRYRLCGRNGKQKMKKQRANRGFCSGDLWDMDSYLLELIPAGVCRYHAYLSCDERASQSSGRPDANLR